MRISRQALPQCHINNRVSVPSLLLAEKEVVTGTVLKNPREKQGETQFGRLPCSYPRALLKRRFWENGSVMKLRSYLRRLGDFSLRNCHRTRHRCP